MDCPQCGAEMRIVRSGVVPENDDTAELPTKIYRVQQLKCMNPGCSNESITEKRHLLYPAEDAE